jgi:hypothetical protein
MVSSTGKIIFAGLLALHLLVPVAGAKSALRTASNAQFEIVGLHERSVVFVEDLSRHVVEVAGRYLDGSALQFPQRILVSLKPPEFVDFEGDYFVRFSERGFVNLDLRWDKSLSLLTTCRALSEALLVRYSIFNYGEKGPGFLPRWPVTAIGTKAYIVLRPAQSQRLIDWTKFTATPTVESLLSRKWDEPFADLNGYLFFLAMEGGGLDRRQVRNLMGRSIAGQNIAEELAAGVLSNGPTTESFGLDDWWRASFEQLLALPAEALETMEASRLWISELADFSNAEIKGLNLNGLWNERESEAMRGLIEARYDILKLRIVRVNPAYFNAARSLGALFETYLAAERRHKYIFNLSVFLGDLEDGRVVQEQVEAALN